MFLGMNPDEVRALARSFTAAAARLTGLLAGVLAGFRGADWFGPDQQDYEGELRESTDRLAELVRRLTETARELEEQADAQDEASESDWWSGGIVRASEGMEIGPEVCGPLGSDRTPEPWRNPWGIGEPYTLDPETQRKLAELAKRGIEEFKKLWKQLEERKDDWPVLRPGGPFRWPGFPPTSTLTTVPEPADPGPYARSSAPLPFLPAVSDEDSGGLFRDALGDRLGREMERKYWQGDFANPLAPEHGSEFGAIGAFSGTRIGKGVGGLSALGSALDDVELGTVSLYDVNEGVRTGDIFQAEDGAIGTALAGADLTANALSVTPIPVVSGIGTVLGLGTSASKDLWARAHLLAIEVDEKGGYGDGSPTRTLFNTPRNVDKFIAQPLAERLPSQIGDPLSVASRSVAMRNAEDEARLDLAGLALKAKLRQDAPRLYSAMGVPRQIIETPRKLLGV